MSQNKFKFPDTGQFSCFDINSKVIDYLRKEDNLFGQNGDFIVNPMSFSKFGNKKENISELATWEDGLRTVCDNNTGLVWEIKSPDKNDVNYYDNTYSWSEAQETYIKKLNDSNYGGYNDWRVPNKEELRTIIDYSKSNPSIDTLYFPNTKIGLYWCNEIYQMQACFGWVLFFGVGSATAASLTSKRYVRAVRGGYEDKSKEIISERLIDNGDGTVTDKYTNLMWQQGENPRMSWFDALKYAKDFKLAGHNDWRLPNIKELNSILNLSYENNWWYYKKFFPADGLQPPLLHYFSSTSYEKYFVWVTNFCFGYDGYYANKNANLLFRLVRNIEKPSSKKNLFLLPESGQNECYDINGNLIPVPERKDSLFGQDGNFKINPFSFTKMYDGAIPVKDMNSDNNVRMIKDNNTGLIWELKSTDKNDINYNAYKCRWDETQKYADKLNKCEFGGFSDWRIPNKEELRTIVNYSDKTHAIDETIFRNLKPDFYWSKEEYGADKKLGWGIYFGYGCGICNLKENLYYVMAVRGGYNKSFGDLAKYAFKDNNDGTVTDLNTNLMWKKDESPDLSFEEALKYCKEMNLGGHNDWRMPNIREMATLLDLSFEDNTWFHKKYFPDVQTAPLGFYWSASTFAATFGWGVNFQFGYDGYYADKINGKYPFRPVRNIS